MFVDFAGWMMVSVGRGTKKRLIGSVYSAEVGPDRGSSIGGQAGWSRLVGWLDVDLLSGLVLTLQQPVRTRENDMQAIFGQS